MAKNRVTIGEGENTKDAVITLIQKKTGQVIDGVEEYNFAPFGVDDENVQIYIQNTSSDNIETQDKTPWGSLRNFFQEWLNFKKIWEHFTKENIFIYYGSKEPSQENVRIWFQEKTSDNS